MDLRLRRRARRARGARRSVGRPPAPRRPPQWGPAVHTNGIEDDYGDPGEDADVYQRMVANIANAHQVHPLDNTHGYSPALGYAILARIMEVIDGRHWDLVSPEGDPLSVGRTRRTFTPAQRKALALRDGGCSLCGRPVAWTAGHHLEHWRTVPPAG